MIVKANRGKPRNFSGVEFEVFAVGAQSMVTKMHYAAGNRVREHSHANEQSGYVITGKYRLRFEGSDELIETGDSYSIPANVDHSLDVLEPGEVIDVFTPPRAEYL